MVKFKRTVFLAVTFTEEAGSGTDHSIESNMDTNGLYKPSTFERAVKQAFDGIFLVSKAEVIMISEHGKV